MEKSAAELPTASRLENPREYHWRGKRRQFDPAPAIRASAAMRLLAFGGALLRVELCHQAVVVRERLEAHRRVAAREQCRERIDIAADAPVAAAGRGLHHLDLPIRREAHEQHHMRM